MYESNAHAAVNGIGNTTLTNVPIGTCAAYVETSSGPAIAWFHQMAYYGKGETILSKVQMQDFALNVDDTSKMLGGTQTVSTPDGWKMPLSIRDGLAYM